MNYTANVKVMTDIVGSNIVINAIACETGETPVIFDSKLLDVDMERNSITGEQGDAILTHTDSSDIIGWINQDGELELELDDDDATRYAVNQETTADNNYISEGELIYDDEEEDNA